MNHFVIMGVSGCGKSTVADLLAKRLNTAMIEADALHSAANIEKMRRGDPLTDDDRWPWLAHVATAMQESETPLIVSCSALRRSYRQCLSDVAQVPIGFIHLHTHRDVIAERMSNRKGHFMPLSLLDSQIELLEPLQDDERGVVVDIDKTIEFVVDEALLFVRKSLPIL